jgi:DNA uptake protein ComE-like DNA-binding protein
MFEFNRRDRIGIITLSILLVVLIVANQFMYLIIPPKQYDYSKYEKLITPKLQQPHRSTSDTLKTLSPDTPQQIVDDGQPANYTPNAVSIVDINTADSLALLDVKGIGPTFASRIIKYRNLLGGFVKKEQLLEVYGFDKEKYDGIKNQVKVAGQHTIINLNTATFKELSRHPYIKYNLTKAIFALKNKLGTFKAVDDIKQIDLVTAELYNKLAPYLTAQ